MERTPRARGLVISAKDGIQFPLSRESGIPAFTAMARESQVVIALLAIVEACDER